MPAYLIEKSQITDHHKFSNYEQLLPPIVKRMGGEYLAQNGDIEDLDGDCFGEWIMVLQFPDVKSARDFYHCSAYQDARMIREECADSRVQLVDSFPFC